MAAPTALAEAVEGWSPGPVTTTDVIGPWPAAAFSALLASGKRSRIVRVV